MLVIAGTIGLSMAGDAVGLPVDDPPDPTELDPIEETGLEVEIPSVPEPGTGLPDPAVPDLGGSAPAPGGPTPVPDRAASSPPVPARETPSMSGTRHVGHRPVDEAARPVPSGPEPGTPVWLAGTNAIPLIAVALYHRLGRDDLLDNRIRARILDAVVEDPGGTVTDYADVADVDRTTARYHLRMLERFDYVMSDRLRGRTRYFENHGRWDAFARRAIAHLRNRSTRQLVAAVLEDPGRPCPDLAERAGLSESAVYRKVDRLAEIGIVRVEGRPKRVRPASSTRDRVDDLVTTLEPT